MKNQISVTVAAEMSPRIESWLARCDIPYEVEVVKVRKATKLKIIATFDKDENGKRRAEMYKKFLERMAKK